MFLSKIDYNNRIFGLDILRSAAIIFVIIQHGQNLLPGKYSFLIRFFTLDGVTIFFVLSGFLIGSILIKTFEENTSFNSLLQFWIRRWFRTLPLYFLILIISSIIYLPIQNLPDDYYKYFTFTQNLYRPHPPFFNEAWSLSVEEWFYLLFPCLVLLLFFIKKNIKKSVLIVSVLIIAGSLIVRYYKYSSLEISDYSQWAYYVRKVVINRFDSIVYGVLGAWMLFYHQSFFLKFKNILLVLGLSIIIIWNTLIFSEIIPSSSQVHIVYTLMIESFAVLLTLPFFYNWKDSKGFFLKFFTVISLISYSMYLLHLQIVKGWLLNIIPWDLFIKNSYLKIIIPYLFYWIATILISWYVYQYFEKPVMHIREFFSFGRYKRIKS